MRRGGQRSSYLTPRQCVTAAAAGLHDWMSPEADATEGRESEGSRDRDKEKEKGENECGRKKVEKRKEGEGHGMRIIRPMIKIKQPFQNLRMQQVHNRKELVMKSP